ncbi:hypothetical protein L1987_58659 [Smallanthus sonchifolius]|uniref:Uncharacterized protein n=1 Tax=Smallanthus sonchifolius TaxID=185202 RepID=A0ACB9DG94_9ASTR|nr:hypothetical protein L1987_58659 [Smallanthus sonchifolius]
MEEVECDHSSDSTPSPVLETAPVGLSTTPAVTKPKVLNVDEDGFITITRRKKMCPIKVQGRKQKPVRVKVASQQYDHVRPIGRQAPAGDKGGKNRQPLSTKIATPPKSIDIDTANRFSVLDIPNSIKFNKLIEVQDDLYPPDQSLEDGMDLDMIRSKDGQNVECQSNQKPVGDQFLASESVFCQMNQEHIEGHSGKTYGISDEQKKAIADHFKTTGSISMDIVNQWSPGQWDFFNDQCTLIGLDPDYCIEDVESDTENGTTQIFSAQMMVGIPKVPSSTQPSSSK